MKKNIKLLVLALFVVCFSSIGVDASSNPQRIFGNDRVETSVRISQSAYTSSNTVILAGFDGQVDSLSGTILAHFKDAPMLLTRKNNLDDVTLKEIERLNPTEIYILGGETVVSKAVEDSLSNYNVTRVSGDRREQTAVNIAQNVVGDSVDEVFLTLGYNEYADALAIGPISGKQKKPIFLTKTNEISKDTKDALKDFGVKRVTIIGGEMVISRSVENQLKSMNIAVDRVFGDDRMETALNIAKVYTSNPSSIIVANGYKYADAVIGGYLAAKENAPILLSKDKLIDIDSLDYIAANRKQTYILGGENVIYNSVLQDIDFVLNKNVIIKDEETELNVLDRVYYRNGEQFRRQTIKTTPTGLERIFIEGTSISGEIHTINVDARSFQKPVYRFYEKNLSENKWIMIQDYSEKSSADWIPKGEGDYLYRADIKEAGSTKDSASQYAPIRIEPSIPAEIRSLDIKGTGEAKTPQTIVADASGVNGVLYKFYVQIGNVGSWTVLQDYSEKSTITWMPEEAGSYNIAVHVKDKKSFQEKEASMSKAVEISPLKPAVIENLRLKGNQYEKNNHTLIADATSTNGVLYKFYIKDENTGEFTILQDFSENNTAVWKPNKSGEFSYYAAVKDKKSDKNRDALLSYTVTINPPIYYKTSEYKDSYEEALKKQSGVKSQNGKWVKASKDEIAGYLKPDKFLQFNPTAREGHIVSVEVKADTLNVRSEPNTTSSVISTVSKGNVYVVLAETSGWYKINAGGKHGWVSGDHAQYVNDVPREMYQFMVLSGQVGVTTSQMNNELKGKGILSGHGAAFIAGSKKYNVNELYLMGHSFLETGNGTSKLANGIMVDTVDGKPVPPRMVYNMYGIGAFDRDPLKHGSERAYTEGWFTPELAITEGAHWISNSYINHPTHKQDTLYKMRFNPANPGTHQYATDIAWAYKQISQIDRIMAYVKRMEGVVLKFDIPKYR